MEYDRICARADNDFLQVHRYYDPGAAMSVCYGPIDVFCADAIRELRDRDSSKPALLAETGAVKPNHTGLSELYASDPEGVLMHDVDVTAGDALGTMIVRGVLDGTKLPANITANQKATLPMITVVGSLS